MTSRATFTFYVALPDGANATLMEGVVTRVMGLLSTGDVRTLQASWSCPTLGRGKTPTGPVLAWRNDEAR